MSLGVRRPIPGIIAVLCMLAFVLAVIPRTATPARADDSQHVTIAQAEAQAADTGEPVLATAATTESSSITANPNGTLTATLGAGPLQEPDPDSSTGWSPIDLSLQHEDGTYAPAVSAADTSFSDGGAGALASLSDGSNTYTEDWGSSLPTPEVSGDIATYSNVLPNIDLVMQAQTAGFKQLFLIHSAPSQALTLDVPLSLRGLTATVDESGNLVVTDAHGNTVATSGTAVMYGAATDSAGEPTISETVDTAIVNVDGTPVFRITPDQSFFSNPELIYPATLDPSPNLSVTTDTYVKSTAAGSSFLTDNGLKVGTPDGSEVDRALLQFPTLDATYRGNSNAIDVSAATLTLHQVDAANCTPSEIDLYQATSNWVTLAGVTWTTQPTIGTMYASASFVAGHSGCSEADETISTGGASGHTLTDLVQDWADGTSANYGFELRAADEATSAGYKKFRSSDYGSNAPTLAVTYNTFPDTPVDMASEFPQTTPTLHATYSDPDGSPGEVLYTIRDTTGAVVVSDAAGATVASGSDSSYTIPTSTLTDGQLYTWSARSYDGTDYSPQTTEPDIVATTDLPDSTDPATNPWGCNLEALRPHASNSGDKKDIKAWGQTLCTSYPSSPIEHLTSNPFTALATRVGATSAEMTLSVIAHPTPLASRHRFATAPPTCPIA
jgi:hypothetical protein